MFMTNLHKAETLNGEMVTWSRSTAQAADPYWLRRLGYSASEGVGVAGRLSQAALVTPWRPWGAAASQEETAWYPASTPDTSNEDAESWSTPVSDFEKSPGVVIIAFGRSDITRDVTTASHHGAATISCHARQPAPDDRVHLTWLFVPLLSLPPPWPLHELDTVSWSDFYFLG